MDIFELWLTNVVASLYQSIFSGLNIAVQWLNITCLLSRKTQNST